MAEVEVWVVCCQVLGVPFADMESFENQVRAWTQQRNNKCVKVNWQFTTKDARIKLKRPTQQYSNYLTDNTLL